MTKDRKKHPKNRIAYWRKIRGKTLEQVGTALGIGKAAASHKEKGKSPLTSSDLDILAALFNCSPSDIIGESGDNAHSKNLLISNDGDIDDQVSSIKRAIRKLPQKEKINLFQWLQLELNGERDPDGGSVPTGKGKSAASSR